MVQPGRWQPIQESSGAVLSGGQLVPIVTTETGEKIFPGQSAPIDRRGHRAVCVRAYARHALHGTHTCTSISHIATLAIDGNVAFRNERFASSCAASFYKIEDE